MPAIDESTNHQLRFLERPWKCVLYSACALACTLFLLSLGPAAIGNIIYGALVLVVMAVHYVMLVLLCRMKRDLEAINEDLHASLKMLRGRMSDSLSRVKRT
jgi:Flp pilus assembly protein TadB